MHKENVHRDDSTSSEPYINVSAYKFVDLDNLVQRRQELLDICYRLELKGTILLAEEGMNGTLSGAEAPLQAFTEVLRSVPGFHDMPFKFSVASADNQVFYRLKVRIKPEIVALGQPDVDGARGLLAADARRGGLPVGRHRACRRTRGMGLSPPFGVSAVLSRRLLGGRARDPGTFGKFACR